MAKFTLGNHELVTQCTLIEGIRLGRVVFVPRVARVQSSSGIYHVMVRGVAQQDIFRDYDDRRRYLRVLARVVENYCLTLYGYCLMDNHVHLLLAQGEETLGASMKRVGVAYAHGFNWKYGRSGHLFQGRYRSEAVEDDAYFITVLRYIHQNPLKAGLCNDCGGFPWSSYRAYAYGRGQLAKLLDTGFALELMGGLGRFVTFTNAANEDSCLELEPKYRLSDADLLAALEVLLGDKAGVPLLELEVAERTSILRGLKAIQGVSTRQIARLTGVSKTTVQRA